MDETTTSSLQYGDAGVPHYMPDGCSWHFSRDLRPVPQFSYTGLNKITVAGSPNPRFDRKGSVQSQISAWLRKYPQLAAISTLKEPESLSNTITSLSEIMDVRTSTLLDFGNALEIENDSASRWIPIAVSVSGQAGDSLSFYRIEDEIVALEDSLKPRIPTIGNTETAIWNGGLGPVRQIQFAQPTSEQSEWMAVRFLSSTVIFRPLYHRYKTLSYQKDDEGFVIPSNQPPSRIDPNPVAEIPVSSAVRRDQVHVTFNPWYQKQLGIIDEGGTWTIWNISGRQRTGIRPPLEFLQSSSLPMLEDESRQGTSLQYDGWAAVEWVGAYNQILACNRRVAVLYLIDSGYSHPQPLELGLTQKSEWILDLKRNSTELSHIYILTTLRIFLVNVRSQPASASSVRQVPLYSLHLTWYHFRDPQDLTLRLSVLSMGKDFSLIVYSRLNDLILNLRNPITSEEDVSLSSGQDFQLVALPREKSESLNLEARTTQSCLLTLVAKDIEQQILLGSNGVSMPSLKFMKIFRLDPRFEIQESLYTLNLLKDDESSEERQNLPPSILRLKKRNFRVVKSNQKTKDILNHFIVKDTEVPCFVLPTATSEKVRTLKLLHRKQPSWTVDCTAAYSLAIGRTRPTKRGRIMDLPSKKAFRYFLDDLTTGISRALPNPPSYSPTLLETLDCYPVLDDLDHATEVFQRFQEFVFRNLDAVDESSFGFIPAKIRTDSSENLITSNREFHVINLTDLYDHIIEDWLFVLSRNVPVRTRVFKEQTIRQIVAELGLARRNRFRYPLKFRHSKRRSNIEETESDALLLGNATEVDLPFTVSQVNSWPWGSRLVKVDEDQEQRRGQAQPLGLLILPSLSQSVQGPFFRNGISSVLSHWTLGGDPGSYDWSKTVKEDEDTRLQVERNKSQRTRSRSRRSQPRIPDDMSRLVRTSPIVPIMQKWGVNSQEEAKLPVIQSSQITDENLPMTQVERGTFGGRDAGKKSTIKARKKKRAAGF